MSFPLFVTLAGALPAVRSARAAGGPPPI